jgi:hypothetical protein
MNSAHLNPFTELPTIGHTSLLQRRDGTLLRPADPSTQNFSALGIIFAGVVGAGRLS